MKLLRLTTCDFMVYKDYKIGLKFIFPVCRINLRIQDITCPLINHFITIHHDIFFLKSFPCEFSHCIFHRPLKPAAFEVHPNTPYRRGYQNQKIISVYLVMVSFISSSSSSLVFMQFRRGIFNFFSSSKKDVLAIYY